MINPVELRKYVIEPSLEYLSQYDDRMMSESAVRLLLGTCAHESLGGYHLHQVGGPALGIYQIEPATHADIYYSYINYRPALGALMRMQPDDCLITDLSYATEIARLIYWRDPEPLPDADDDMGLAEYWKKHYNTVLGHGSTLGWLDNYTMVRGAL